LGDWKLVRLLGEGVYTQVYLARPDDNHDATYAVKTLRPARANDPVALRMLSGEAYVGLKVAHPHVVSVLSAHVNQPPYYLVMPYLPGGTLRQRLIATGRLPVGIAMWIARQAAHGLAAIHEAGLIHGDIKPENIFLSPQGHATLIDLGFAKAIDKTDDGTTCPIAGTPHYLAPEALAHPARYDVRSDFYSLGITIFEMLAGAPPFSAAGPTDLARQHREAVAHDVRQLAPGTPPAVAELIARLLAKQPLRRPASARELVDRLLRLEISTLGQRTLEPLD
jgi:serine/threonine protein kinase